MALAIPATPSFATDSEAARIASIVDPIVLRELGSGGIPGAAFVFVRDGRIVHQRGYGFSDVATKTPADPERTIWPIASITKTVTALAALQLVDDKRVDLDADINRSLKRLQVTTREYGPLTLRHLLSHTAGLDELPGRRFDGKQRQDMAAFLKDRLLRYRAPGVLTAYSSYGVALAGVMIEDVSGQSYASYLAQHVFQPARMSSARVMEVRGDEKGVATPYEIEDGRANPIEHEFYVTTPTSSVVASASDMGRLLTVFLEQRNALGQDSAGSNRILSVELTRAMQTQQATVHPELSGWGLGFQMDKVNGVQVAEHGGDIAGFSSLLVLMPGKGSGFFIVHHGEGGNLRFDVKQALFDALYPAAPMSVPPRDPGKAAELAEYAGRYLSTFACRSCPQSDEQVFVVQATPDGTLSLWGQRWIPLRRDLFVRDDGKRLLGFARDSGGRITAVSGGSWRVADRVKNP